MPSDVAARPIVAGPPLSREPLGTGSRTLADLLPLAAQRYGDAIATRHKAGGEWVDTTYAQLGEIVREVGLGLIDLGIAPGDRVAILAHTRPEWNHVSFAVHGTGAVLVTIYQSNSAPECRYVLEHSDAVAVFAEDAGQLDKVRAVRDRCPRLEHVVVIDPAGARLAGGEISLAQLRERGARRDEAQWEARYRAVAPGDVAVSIYTSGTTGPPKGCLLTHANYRMTTDSGSQVGMVTHDDVTYLFLPLAHGFAFLVALQAFDMGSTLAYWSRDQAAIAAELREVNPTYFPSVPRLFEKLYAAAVAAGLQGNAARALLGSRIQRAVTGGAPIAPEILEFFNGCGIAMVEGFGMTETATVATINPADDYRIGSVGRPVPGVELQIAPDDELLVRGANIFQGYYKNPEATREALDDDGWLHTGDLGRIDDDGFLYITGRKKDIIITSGGKNITPANLENDLKLSPFISQAVVVGDRRPYLVALITLDAEEAPWPPGDPAARAAIQEAVDAVNARVGPVEQIKRFEILSRDLSQEAGELTPSLKVKRSAVAAKYGDLVDDLYARER